MSFALQTLPPKPGAASTTAETSAPAGPPPDAVPTDDGGSSSLMSNALLIIPFLLLFVMMFWSSRSAAKRQEKALGDLKKGDMVLTQAGIRGKLVEMGDRFFKVEIAPGTKVEVLRTSVLGKDSADTAAQLDKK